MKISILPHPSCAVPERCDLFQLTSAFVLARGKEQGQVTVSNGKPVEVCGRGGGELAPVTDEGITGGLRDGAVSAMAPGMRKM
jgi:hypothetical protein